MSTHPYHASQRCGLSQDVYLPHIVPATAPDTNSVTVTSHHHSHGAKPKGLAAEVIKGGIFERCFVESGALAWPNGLAVPRRYPSLDRRTGRAPGGIGSLVLGFEGWIDKQSNEFVRRRFGFGDTMTA